MSSSPQTKDIIQYALIGFPLAFAGLPLYIHAPDFYVAEIGINIGAIGLVLLFIRLIDAIQDPIIGRLSDLHADKRPLIMFCGGGLLTLGMALLFAITPTIIHPLVWFGLSMILATTGFSIVAINITMIGSLWSRDEEQKNKISAWREAFALIGLLTASILPAAITIEYGTIKAYEVLFFTFSISLLLAYLLFARTYPKTQARPLEAGGRSAHSHYNFLRILSGNLKPFWLICFLNHLAASIPAVLVLFFIRDYLGAYQYTGLFLVLYFASGALFMPLWVKLARAIGQEKSWLCSMVLAVLTFQWTFWLEENDLILYGAICLAAGVALGGDLAFPPALLGKYIDQKNVQAEATQHYALLALIPKVSVAIASGCAFLYLGLQGFQAGSDNDQQALSALITVYAFIPCLIKVAAVVAMGQWIKTKENPQNETT